MITEFRNQTYLYTRKGHCVFLQRIMERFLSGSLRAFQWEGARDVKIGANHWHTTAELHYLPTYLRWKHQNILTDPLPLGQFLHLLPTPLWMTRLLSSFFPGRKFAFFSIAGTFGRGAAPFLGQLVHFMNHNTLYRLPPLHCCQPIWGCATAGGGGLGGGVGGGDDGGDRLDENKSGREQWWCLFPGTDWSAAFPFFSSLPVFVVTCSCSKYNADRNRDKT